MNQRGFTLVEMLVALTIFALLAGAGVGLLRASVDTQAAVGGRLADMAASERMRLLLASDLAQAVDRSGRAPDGSPRPAFAGTGNGIELVRAGWTDPQGTPALQRVSWQVQGGSLTRMGSGDGAASQASPAPLLTNVERAAFRFRAADGSWRDGWAPGPGDPALPVAIELSVQRRGEAPLLLILALPPSSPPAAAQPPARAA